MGLDYNFKEQKKLMELKYAANIAGISKANNMDLGVAFDMLLANYRFVCAGDYSEVYPGGGPLDFGELGSDIKKLDEARR